MVSYTAGNLRVLSHGLVYLWIPIAKIGVIPPSWVIRA